jgi:hypothetical protein
VVQVITETSLKNLPNCFMWLNMFKEMGLKNNLRHPN